jgi:hypothetical protein
MEPCSRFFLKAAYVANLATSSARDFLGPRISLRNRFLRFSEQVFETTKLLCGASTES